MSVLIVIPVLNRPQNAAPVLRSIEAATPEPHRVLFVANEGDTAEHDAVRAAGGDLLLVGRHDPRKWQGHPGDYARKINAAAAASEEPYLFLAADDLLFHDGWLTAALARMSSTVGVVGTQDLGSPRVLAGLHSTHTLVARWYVDQYGTIDQPGIVLCEEYPHEFVDDELVGTAKSRRAWAFAGDSVVEHLHPSWGKAPTDAMYNLQGERMRAGRVIFQRRQKLWVKRGPASRRLR